MMSLFLSQLSIPHHVPGRVLTAPPLYLEKAIPDPITMKGNSCGCVCSGNSLWAAQGTLPSASEPNLGCPSCRVGVMPSHLIPACPHQETEKWTAQPGPALQRGGGVKGGSQAKGRTRGVALYCPSPGSKLEQ